MSFELDLRAFIAKAKGNADQVVRKVGTDMLAQIVDMSPVGNPELWAINKDAAQYNAEVMQYTADLRKDSKNLTKNGRLRRGLRLNDGMDIVKPDGYVGGRFRGNWQVTFGSEASAPLERIDPRGASTKAAGAAVLAAYKAGVTSIWLSNQLPYGMPLEYGWSDQAPNGMVRITAGDFQKFINRSVQELDR